MQQVVYCNIYAIWIRYALGSRFSLVYLGFLPLCLGFLPLFFLSLFFLSSLFLSQFFLSSLLVYPVVPTYARAKGHWQTTYVAESDEREREHVVAMTASASKVRAHVSVRPIHIHEAAMRLYFHDNCEYKYGLYHVYFFSEFE